MPMQQRPSTSGLGRAALLLVVLTICCRRSVEAFLVPPAATPAAARAAVRAASSPSLPSGLWLGKRGSSGSGSGGRLYARISEKPGDKADREQEGEQGLPVLGGSGAGGGDEMPKLTRQQEEAIDASMGVIPPEQEELTGEAWTAEVERRLQQMYEKGTYDPTPINLTPQELARQQWVDEFLSKEERPIGWDLTYWFGTWTRGDIKYSSPGRGLKSFGFALVGIGLVTLLFILEDEFLNPLFEDYQRWDGNDVFHVGGDLGAWAGSVPGRVQGYFAHFDWREFSTRVAARAGAAPRWYQQIIPQLPGDSPP